MTHIKLVQYEKDYIPNEGDIPRSAGKPVSPGISGSSGIPVNRGRADIPLVSSDISVPSIMLLFLKAVLDEADDDDDEEKKEAVEMKENKRIVELCFKFSF